VNSAHQFCDPHIRTFRRRHIATHLTMLFILMSKARFRRSSLYSLCNRAFKCWHFWKFSPLQCLPHKGVLFLSLA